MKLKRLLVLLFLAAFSTLTLPVLAVSKTVTLAVPGMYCEVCPITVKKALTKVGGVTKANVSYERKEAVVTFDDAKTTVEALTKATADAGYPSTVKP